ncbi:winged helix-turn-helix domain-containing protein [Labrys neptuniae]|uniref:Winged helix-turn-helix domain-containing protein n=1 Tax=Labrys neptuniae TaxID=376174 RepID=A0ABV3PG63_9HYPH
MIDADQSLVTYGGTTIRLSPNHFILFDTLAKAYPRIVTRDQIYDSLYALRPDCDWPELKIIDVMICKVRPQLAPIGMTIETAWGRGWKLAAGTVSPDAVAIASDRLRKRSA